MFSESMMMFQSGQKVTVTGRYSLVGMTSGTARQDRYAIELTEGDYFPYYDGFEVCWLLTETLSAPALSA